MTIYVLGWSEIPEVIGSTGLAIVGLGMSGKCLIYLSTVYIYEVKRFVFDKFAFNGGKNVYVFFYVIFNGMSGIGIWRYYRNDGDNRRYKGTYVVYRDTDPRVATLRKD